MAYFESTHKPELKKIPTVVWLTGLSGSGKTTTGKRLYDVLKTNYDKVAFLDGDDVRKYFIENKGKAYGFSLDDRKQFVSNVVYIAKNMIEFQNAVVVIIALISPLREMRDNARHIFETYSNASFIEVYMDTPLLTCEQRDPKGLYKKARAGEIKDFTGIDSPYQAPLEPEIWLPTKSSYWGKELTVDKAVSIIYNNITQ